MKKKLFIVVFLAAIAKSLCKWKCEMDDVIRLTPGKVFELSCSIPANESQQNIEFQFKANGMQTISLQNNTFITTYNYSEGVKYKNILVRCLWNVTNRRYLNGMTCQNQNHKWINTQLHENVSLPRTILFEYIGSDESSKGLQHIGLPPAPVSDLSCRIFNYKEMDCSWSPQPHQLAPAAAPSEHNSVNYTVTVSESYFPHDFLLQCVETNKTCCLMKDSASLFISELNVTVVAKGTFGSATSSLVCYFPVKPPVKLILTASSIVKRVSSNNEETYLNISSNLKSKNHRLVLFPTILHDVEVELQILQTSKSIEEVESLIQDLEHKKSKNMETVKASPNCGTMEPALPVKSKIMENEKWDDYVQYLNDINLNLQLIRVLPNATVAIRGRYVLRDGAAKNCGENIWSPFVNGNVIKVNATKPGTPTVTSLWFRDELITQLLPEKTSWALTLWKQNESAKYTYNNQIKQLLWSTNCTGNKNTKNRLNFTLGLRLINDAGKSNQKVITVDEDGHLIPDVLNPDLVPLNATTARVTFNISCLPHLDGNSCKRMHRNVNLNRLALVSYFWKIEKDFYLVKDIIKTLQQHKNWFGDSSFTTANNEHGSDYFMTSSKKQCVSGSLESGKKSQGKHLHFTTSKIYRLTNGSFRSTISYDFSSFVVYRFAFSLIKDQNQGPATVIPSGFAFKMKEPSAPPHDIEISQSAGTIVISWAPVYLQNQHSPITNYTVYVSNTIDCGNVGAQPESLACSATCPQPSSIRSVEVSNPAALSIWSKNEIQDSFTSKSSFSVELPYLEQGKHYYIRISAANAYGEGPCSKAYQTMKIKKQHFCSTSECLVPVCLLSFCVMSVVAFLLKIYCSGSVPIPKMKVDMTEQSSPTFESSCVQSEKYDSISTWRFLNEDNKGDLNGNETNDVVDTDELSETNEICNIQHLDEMITVTYEPHKMIENGYTDTNEALLLGEKFRKNSLLKVCSEISTVKVY